MNGEYTESYCECSILILDVLVVSSVCVVLEGRGSKPRQTAKISFFRAIIYFINRKFSYNKQYM
jgi:hypothetical protein